MCKQDNSNQPITRTLHKYLHILQIFFESLSLTPLDCYIDKPWEASLIIH